MGTLLFKLSMVLYPISLAMEAPRATALLTAGVGTGDIYTFNSHRRPLWKEREVVYLFTCEYEGCV